jgi:hypothetical protein
MSRARSFANPPGALASLRVGDVLD